MIPANSWIISPAALQRVGGGGEVHQGCTMFIFAKKKKEIERQYAFLTCSGIILCFFDCNNVSTLYSSSSVVKLSKRSWKQRSVTLKKATAALFSFSHYCVGVSEIDPAVEQRTLPDAWKELKGSVEWSRHERHFCSLLPYFLLSWLQIFQLCLSFWTSSFDMVLFKKFLQEKEKYPKNLPKRPSS